MTLHQVLLKGLAALALAASAASGWSSLPRYSLVKIDPDWSYPNLRPLGMNNRGTVVGLAQVTNGQYSAFLWNNGLVQYGETFLGGGEAHAINNFGVMVGACGHPYSSSQACYWDRNLRIHPLGNEQDPLYYSVARAINDRGSITGLSWTSGPPYRYTSVIWRDGREIRLGQLNRGIRNEPWAISDSGWLVGEETDREFGMTWGWLWTELTGMVELPLVPRDINDRNVICGYDGWPVIYKDGVKTRLMESRNFLAYKINDRGDVLLSDGYTLTLHRDGVNTPVVELLLPRYRSEIESLDWSIEFNDRGQILCYGDEFDGGGGGYYLLTPVPESSPGIRVP